MTTIMEEFEAIKEKTEELRKLAGIEKEELCQECGGELTSRMAGDESYEKCTSCLAVSTK